jgi:peptidyl-prolyl cis-trans isomerase A (cyclophilin A)
MRNLPSLVALALLLAACDHKTPEPAPSASPAPSEHATPVASAAPTASAAPRPVQSAPAPVVRTPATVPVSPDDPAQGKWTLAEATAGLPASGTLTATIDTDLGAFECKLFDEKAPISVANFVGLARGLRPWKAPDGKWVKKPAYDGTSFHRVIKGFMIQGGDPKGDGSGEPGYVIPDEMWEGARHDRAGLLCMANRGPNTNGQQFFITDAAAPHLDRGYTIFGECAPTELVTKIASVEKGPGDRPVKPVKIKSVKIKRK